MPEVAPEVQAQFEALRQNYIAQLPEHLRRAHELWKQLVQEEWAATTCYDFHRLMHSLAGSGATFGVPTVSTSARALELYLKALMDRSAPATGEQRNEIDLLLQDLAQTIHDAGNNSRTPIDLLASPTVDSPAKRSVPDIIPDLFDDHMALMRILVVDDDPHIRRLLEMWLARRGCQVETAESGEAALLRLESEPAPDIMFLDVLMPGINGLQVLDLIRDQVQNMAIIMTTAFGSEQVAINALRRGADDYLRKPFDAREFQAILRRTTERLRLSRQNIALRTELDEKHRLLEVELSRAARVQADLLPTRTPKLPGFDLAARCIPTRDVGGDFYDWQMPASNLLNLTMGDVMGKGMPAALLMATVRATFRAVARQTPPSVNLRYSAAALEDDMLRSESFVTLFHAQLDLTTRRLTYIDAGHGHAFVRRAGGAVLELTERGMPLGILPNQVYEEGVVDLQPGDAFVLYSDGLTDLRPQAENHRQFLADLIAQSTTAQNMVDRLLALPSLIGPSTDDLTVLALYCNKEAATDA